MSDNSSISSDSESAITASNTTAATNDPQQPPVLPDLDNNYTSTFEEFSFHKDDFSPNVTDDEDDVKFYYMSD